MNKGCRIAGGSHGEFFIFFLSRTIPWYPPTCIYYYYCVHIWHYCMQIYYCYIIIIVCIIFYLICHFIINVVIFIILCKYIYCHIYCHNCLPIYHCHNHYHFYLKTSHYHFVCKYFVMIFLPMMDHPDACNAAAQKEANGLKLFIKPIQGTSEKSASNISNISVPSTALF